MPARLLANAFAAAALAFMVTAGAAVPGAPTNVLAIPGNARATIHLAPPASDGGSPITAYTVTASPGGASASGPGWPLVVTGLANGTTYTFTARATNASGNSALSAASNPVTPYISPTIAPAVVTSRDLSMALDASGQVYAWGGDDWGQLGQGRPLVQSSPAQVPGLPSITYIALNNHALAVDSTGQVWSWGDGSCGQLGPRDSANTAIPARVIGATGMTQVAAGRCSSWALKSDGTVWKWGNYGQPVHQVPGLTGITQISAHGEHVLAMQGLSYGNSVWAYGDNFFGQLGQGNTSPNANAVQIAFPPDVYQFGAISAGVDGSAAMGYGDGGFKLFFWGRFNYGTTYTSPVQVTGVTQTNTISLINGGMATVEANTGNVWKWTSNLTSPTQVTGFSGAGYTPIEYSDNFGYIDTIFTISGGTLTGKGNNYNGQLGQGHTNPISGAVVVPGFSGNTAQVRLGAYKASVLALKGDGTVWFWGLDGAGLIGNTKFIGSSTPLAVPVPATIKSVAVGLDFGIALDTTGQVWGWGSNQFGQFDTNRVSRSAPAPIAAASNVKAIAAGGSANIAMAKNDGTAWTTYTFGFTDTGLTNVVDVAANYNNLYFIRGDGSLYAMGYNLGGELGIGTFTQHDTPVAVTGITGTVKKVATQGSLVTALMTDGRVYAWGFGADICPPPGIPTPFLAPGITNAVDVAVATQGILIRLADGSVKGWGYGTYLAEASAQNTSQPFPISLPDGPVQAMALDTVGFSVGKTGLLWGWGLSGLPPTYGTVGDGTYIRRTAPVVVFAHAGSGSLDGNNWFLDLQPGTAEIVPAAKVPSAIATAQLFGAKEATGLRGTVNYKTADLGKKVNNYVIALVPAGFFSLAKSAAGTSSKERLEAKAAKSGGFVLAQLTPSGWTDVNGQLIAYSQGTANAAGGASNILNGINSTLIPGARFCVGYGETGDAMLTSGQLRAVLEVEGATATSSGVPCVISGVYVSGPATSVQSTPVTFTASVVGLSPTGSVQFQDGATGLGPALAISASNPAVGTAAYTTSTLALGAHSIGANYSGDGGNPAASTDIPKLHVVSAPLAQTLVTINGPSSSGLGQEIAFVAGVTGNQPTGTVQFRDGGAAHGSPVPLVEGTATLRTSALPLGTRVIDALYSGDGQNATGTSSTRSHVVTSTPPAVVAFASSANPSVLGASVTFTATVAGSGTPTGNVTLMEGATSRGTTALIAGVATFTSSSLVPGAHALYADYAGDASNSQATSPTLYQQVAEPPRSTLAVSKAGSGNGAVASSVPVGAISCGSNCTGFIVTGTAATLVATPASDAIFSGWSGACTGMGNCNVFMDAAKSVTATFTQTYVLQVGKAGTGSGTVTSSAPAGAIDCGSTCSATLLTGTSVTLAAAPSGSTFTGWGGACAGTGGCTLTMDGNKNVSATFTASAILGLSPLSVDFGGQSMATTSPAVPIVVANNGSLPLTVTAVELPNTQFARTHNCATVAAGSSCTVNVTFTPAVSTGANVPTSGTLTVKTQEAGNASASLFGTGEKSLVTHYYRSILRRAPDAGGKTYWQNEAQRVANLGANVNEVWFAMAQQFYFSGEYAALNRDNTGFITDLYNTFFNRAPDSGGLNFWLGNLNGGMPREVALAEFMFSAEFGNFTSAIFGNTAARAEVNTVVDFYRGLLARLPDDGGFAFWLEKFRTAQCTQPPSAAAAAITAQVEAISQAYTQSTEYAARGRTNAQYVGDLYNAFLRRGGDLGGVQFWIGQVSSGSQTREAVRVQFKNSPEFQARVQAIIAQGCL